MIGRVVSVKSKNTATVLIERMAEHPLYKKTFKRSKKYLTEDLKGVKEGDIVEIIKTRPVSKRKHWQIAKVLGKSMAQMADKQMKKKAEEIIAEVLPAEKTKEQSVVSGQIEEKKLKTKKGKKSDS